MQGDLKKWYPEVADKVTVTLIEALPNILPSFSKTLVEYTMGNFKEQDIDVKTKHMVKDVDEKFVHVQDPQGQMLKIPYGLLVWAAGNTARPITRDLMSQLSDAQKNRRGLEVDEHMRLKGAEDSVFAVGDATATQYAPTAQAASQQGSYLARVFNQLGRVESLEQQLEQVKKQPITDATANQIVALEKQIKKAAKIRPFHYTHQGSLAYIGKDKAIADIPLFGGDFASSGVATYVFWQSAYWSMLFSIRNRALVSIDWLSELHATELLYFHALIPFCLFQRSRCLVATSRESRLTSALFEGGSAGKRPIPNPQGESYCIYRDCAPIRNSAKKSIFPTLVCLHAFHATSCP